MASGRFCLVDSDAARAPGIYVFAPDRSLTSGWPAPAPVILCGQQWTPQGAAVVVSLWARGGCGNACCCHVQTSGTLNTPVLQDLAAGWRRERQLAGLCVNTSSRLPPTIRPFRQRQRSWRNGTWSGHHITPCLRVWQYMFIRLEPFDSLSIYRHQYYYHPTNIYLFLRRGLFPWSIVNFSFILVGHNVVGSWMKKMSKKMSDRNRKLRSCLDISCKVLKWNLCTFEVLNID